MAVKLHTPLKPPGVRSLVIRFGSLIAVVLGTVVVLHWEGGLIDQKTGSAPSFIDTLYFTMVTITTVGYGDIVPVSSFSRLVDTFFLTPIRLIVLLLFVGIAYELTLKQFREEYRMNRAVEKLNGHYIVCGFGETGRVAVEELLLQGVKGDQIVVIDTNAHVLDEAARMGVVAVEGRAEREKVLKSVAIELAQYVLVCPGRDDTAVLIALTAHDLNPKAQLVVMCHERENVRLARRSGAQTIISPTGGNLVAAATRRPHLVATMLDILEVGGDVYLDERPVTQAEVGTRPAELSEIAVVRLYRGREHFSVPNLPVIEKGDVLVYVAEGQTDAKGSET